MRRLILATALVLIAAPAAAQEVTPEIQAMINDPDFRLLELKIGETGTLVQHVVYAKEKTGPDGKTVRGKTDTTYELAYAPFGDGYAVSKSLDRFQVLSMEIPGMTPGSPQAQLAAGMMSLATNVSNVDYVTDDSLVPQKLNDWDGLRARVKTGLGDVFTQAGAPKEASGQVTQIVDGMFSQLTPESAAGLFLPGDVLLSVPHNIGLVLHKPLNSDGQIAAPFGGVMIDATETLVMTSYDEAANTAHVSYDFAPTEASLKSFLTTGVPTMMKQMGAPDSAVSDFAAQVKTAPADSLMAASTHCDFEVAIDTGLVNKGMCVRVSAFNLAGQSMKQSETYELSETIKK